MTTIQSKYWAAQLSLVGPAGSLEQVSRSISNARVDLNPHQVDAALFALRSPLSHGVILADEVGLGKTIEAGLVMAQHWAEGRRRILVVAPATLRSQWAREMEEKFDLPARIVDGPSLKKLARTGVANPLEPDGEVLVCSYHFAAGRPAELGRIPWDLVVIDEAHRVRNVYKRRNQMAQALRETFEGRKKLLLTATPLQNTLLELYGLVSFIDLHVFGDEQSFRAQFTRSEDDPAQVASLRTRLAPICHRTLRRQVADSIRFTRRIPLTFDFYPGPDEAELYDGISEYLRRPQLFALPAAQRPLMTMVLRKLLASSSFAIAGTLRRLVERLREDLEAMPGAALESAVSGDFEALNETRDEWGVAAPAEGTLEAILADEREALAKEIETLDGYVALADNIRRNAKGEALVVALGRMVYSRLAWRCGTPQRGYHHECRSLLVAAARRVTPA